jgi:hypothetical protein
MPDIVAQIVWVRQIASKIDDTCQTVTTLLGDLSGTDRFMEETLDFLEELKTSEKERVCCVSFFSSKITLGFSSISGLRRFCKHLTTRLTRADCSSRPPVA